MKPKLLQTTTEPSHICPSNSSSNDSDPEPRGEAEHYAHEQQREQRRTLDPAMPQPAQRLGAAGERLPLWRLDVHEVGDPFEGELRLVSQSAFGPVVHQELVESVADKLLGVDWLA